MPQREDGEVQGDEGGEGEEIVHSNGTENRIKALEDAQQNNQARDMLNRMIADPEVAAVLRAKQAGKAVKVVEDAGEEEVEAEVDPTDEVVKGMAEDDPQRQLITTVSKLVDAKSEAKTAKLMAEIEELKSQLGSVQDVANQVKRKEVTEAVTSAKSKFKDFDEFKGKMLELSKDNPNLSVEDLYFVAKARSGKLRQVEAVTETEKPTSQPRRVGKPGSTPKRSRGRAGFHEMLADSFSRTSLEGTENL